MQPQKPGRGKRLYLINRDFQLRYVRSAMVVALLSTVITMALVLLPLFQFRIIRFPMFVPPPFIGAILIAAGINFALVAYLGILMTHRVAGPMFSLVRQMHLLQRGRLPPALRVRQADDLKYVVRNFNVLLEYLQKQTQQDLLCIEAVTKALEGGQSGVALDEAKRLVERFSARLGPAQPSSAAPSGGSPA